MAVVRLPAAALREVCLPGAVARLSGPAADS
jgi:hypothetical protein